MTSITEMLASMDSFRTVLLLLERTGRMGLLNGEELFTLFAPTDDSIARLPPGLLDDLLDSLGDLANLVNYHILSGEVPAAQLLGQDWCSTISGLDLKIHQTSGTLMVDDKVVTECDIQCSNGLIHIIDGMLIPGNVRVMPLLY